MTNELEPKQPPAQSFPTHEEANDALRTYAWKRAESTGNPHDFEDFVAAHTVLEIEPGCFVLALKAGFSPVTFTS